MNVTLNGNKIKVDEDLIVTSLLSSQNVPYPDMVSVQINGDILERETFETTVIKEDDEIEFLFFMGGG